jgi:hypothetical protein
MGTSGAPGLRHPTGLKVLAQKRRRQRSTCAKAFSRFDENNLGLPVDLVFRGGGLPGGRLTGTAGQSGKSRCEETKNDIPIISAPGCFRSAKPNVVDLVFPPMLARYRIFAWDVACLGHGGEHGWVSYRTNPAFQDLLISKYSFNSTTTPCCAFRKN